MLFHQISALLFTLFAAAAVAGGKKSRSGHPQATCLIHQKTNYRDTYIIRGRNWNITEADFISAINSGGTVLSAWERMEGIDYDDAHVFKAKVREIPCCLLLSSTTEIIVHWLCNADTIFFLHLLVQNTDQRGQENEEETGQAG